MSQKGGKYERDTCRDLSLWWSGGKDDDLFWRSSQSGGRATRRAKKGKKTTGHCGDICATDKQGEPLTKLITIELKRGYNKTTPLDLFDKGKMALHPAFDEFIEQAYEAAERAGTDYWMLIHRRDSRQSMVYVPFRLYKLLDEPAPKKKIKFQVFCRGVGQISIVGLQLTHFFRDVNPSELRAISDGEPDDL